MQANHRLAMNENDQVRAVSQATGVKSANSVGGRPFLKIVTRSTALGFAFAAASLEALRSTPDGFAFHVSAMTFVAAAAGAGLTFGYWRLVARSRRWARWGNFFLALAGVALFFYPLRFVSSAKLPDIGVGLFVAACAISFGGWLLYRVGQFLKADSLTVEDEE